MGPTKSTQPVFNPLVPDMLPAAKLLLHPSLIGKMETQVGERDTQVTLCLANTDVGQGCVSLGMGH